MFQPNKKAIDVFVYRFYPFHFIDLTENVIYNICKGCSMKNNAAVLVVDDEFKITEAVSAYLINKNFIVYTAETGEEALEIFNERRINFIILDLMLPDITGEAVCTEIRKKSDVPIIMLTAKTQEEDILRGLAIGADDYVLKPFSLKQLYARMEAVMRRAADSLKPSASQFSWNGGDLKIDFRKMELFKGGVEIYLTSSEWKILSAMVKHPQTVFTRDKLIDAAFGDDFEGYDRAIDTHIKNLRKKIETDTKNPQYILTVRGSGYKFGGEN